MRKRQYLAGVTALLFCLALLTGCVSNPSNQTNTPGTVLVPGALEYNGVQYQPREDQTVILILGLDKFEHPEGYDGYINNMQSDFMALLILDHTAEVYNLLHLNRDTMTKIRRLGVGGGGAGSYTGQLALAHTYGSGGSDSCLNAVRAVSDLLCGIQIHHYMSLTMDAVAVINDAVGGVTLTVMDDFTQMDPSMEQGKEVTLMGEQALLYVRARMNLEDSSNLHRMERQRQYMEALYQATMERQAQDDDFLMNTMLQISDSFVSDCTVNQLDALAEQMENYTFGRAFSLEGEAVRGEQFMEFYVDEEALKETVIQQFFQQPTN